MPSVMPTTTCQSCGVPLHGEGVGGICPKCLLDGTTAEGTVPHPEPPPIEAIAELIPDVEILELIGHGGMGFVYRARQPKLGRDVAIKVLPSDRAADPEFRERFLREARTLASLSHTNIVSIYDIGEKEDFLYFVMEYVEGASLAELIHAGELTPVEALRLIPQMCDALEFAHQHGVVHRDIKPGNILLDQTGRVKIADFGIAKVLSPEESRDGITMTNDSMGTLGYCAPEQQGQAQQVDHRADIYSLGAVIYEMLTGELPVGSFAPPSKMVQVDVRMDEVVLRALDAKPECRYQHAKEVKEEVEEIANGPGATRPRKRWLCAALVLLSASIAGILIWSPADPDSAVGADHKVDEKAPLEPRMIIVETGNEFRTFRDAFEELQPGQTIQIHGTVNGPILFRGARHRDVTLEGADGAVLQCATGVKFLIGVVDVSGVTVRNLTLRFAGPPVAGKSPPLVVAGLRVSGVTFANLNLESSASGHGIGINLDQLAIPPAEPPLVIRGCKFSGFSTGVSINGTRSDDPTLNTPNPLRGILVIDNQFTSGLTGVSILGALSDAVVAGNRFLRCRQTGFQMQNFFPETSNLLIANNTLLECGQAFRLLDNGDIDGDKSVRIINNLSLACDDELDWAVYDSPDPRGAGRKPGNGRALHDRWTIRNNFREYPVPPPDPKWIAAWIPPGPDDLHAKLLPEMERDPKSRNFLRPGKTSLVATRGAGVALPSYIGALPPEGTAQHQAWSIPKQP